MPYCNAARRTLIRRAVVLSAATLLAASPVSGNTRGDAVRGAAKAAACAACHGTPVRPPLPGIPTLAGQQAEFLVQQSFLMREGLREIPQMAGLLKGFTDGDLEDVAAYFSVQQPLRDSGKRDQQLYARGRDLAQGLACGSCHLADFFGQRHIPRITNQREDYLAATLQAYREDKRVGTDTNMNAAMYGMTDSDIRALAHFLAHQ